MADSTFELYTESSSEMFPGKTITLCTRISKWGITRLNKFVIAFIEYMLRKTENKIAFIVCDLPNHFSYTNDNIGQLLSALGGAGQVPIIPQSTQPDNNRELFSLYADKYLSRTNLTPRGYDKFCVYCGSPLCTKNHFDLKFLEIFEMKDIWHFFSNKILLSSPFKTNKQLNKEENEIIFMIDLDYRNLTVFNRTTGEVNNCRSIASKFLEVILSKNTNKKVLPLSTWCFFSFWTNEFPFQNLKHIYPEKILKQYPWLEYYDAMIAFANHDFNKNLLRVNVELKRIRKNALI